MSITPETRRLLEYRSSGWCECSKECAERATDAHHMLADTKVNRAKFPLFIDSIFNLKHLNNGCHLNKPVPRIGEREAQVFEEYLQEMIDEYKQKGGG